MLPKSEHPVFKITLPGSKKVVSFRPFKVKELKILLQANNSGGDSFEHTADAIINILEECTFKKVNLKELPMYDIDYLFMHLRAKSSGEVINAKYTCENEECKNQVIINLNVNDIVLKYPDPNWKESETILINPAEKFGIKLKPPEFRQFKALSTSKEFLQTFDNFAYSMIDCIFKDEEVYLPGKDYSFKELVEFIDDQPDWIVKRIQKYVDALPYIVIEKEIRCPKCKTETRLEVRDLENFFD